MTVSVPDPDALAMPVPTWIRYVVPAVTANDTFVVLWVNVVNVLSDVPVYTPRYLVPDVPPVIASWIVWFTAGV